MLEIKIILLSQSTLDLESAVKAAATGTAWLKTTETILPRIALPLAAWAASRNSENAGSK
jgi:hypothetical protein